MDKRYLRMYKKSEDKDKRVYQIQNLEIDGPKFYKSKHKSGKKLYKPKKITCARVIPGHKARNNMIKSARAYAKMLKQEENANNIAIDVLKRYEIK